MTAIKSIDLQRAVGTEASRHSARSPASALRIEERELEAEAEAGE